MLSYIEDIYPMYREWADCMIDRHWYLDRSDFMCDPAPGSSFPDHGHARRTYAKLTHPNPIARMPPGGPYLSEEQLAKYRQWMDEGFNP